jgi:hypothetical protein
MKRFLVKISVFSLVVLGFISIVFLQIDGENDKYYLRISSKKQTSLVVGTSRAAQGIKPSILNSCLGRNDIYNFSFTIMHSPFGKSYFNKIKQKLDTTNQVDGIFIIAIDPWSLSTDSIKEISYFREEKTFINGLKNVNTHPNYMYLLKYYEDKYINLLSSSKSFELHPDGWLEIKIAMDSISIDRRTKLKVEDYIKTKLYTNKYSKYREEYLIKTIDLFKRFGKVTLVRLPIDKKLMALENKYMPDFSKKIDSISKEKKVDYIDLTYLNDSVTFTDGNHLHKNSSEIISKIIAKEIQIKY